MLAGQSGNISLGVVKGLIDDFTGDKFIKYCRKSFNSLFLSIFDRKLQNVKIRLPSAFECNFSIFNFYNENNLNTFHRSDILDYINSATKFTNEHEVLARVGGHSNKDEGSPNRTSDDSIS